MSTLQYASGKDGYLKDVEVGPRVDFHRTPPLIDFLRLGRHVVQVYGVETARHLYQGRLGKVAREELGVNCGGHEDELDVGPPVAEFPQQCHQQVNVRAALVDFVENDNVVLG